MHASMLKKSLWPEEGGANTLEGARSADELRNHFRTEKPFSLVTQIYDPAASSRAVIRLRRAISTVDSAEALEEAHRTALAVLPEEVARALGTVAAKVVSVLHLRTPLVATQTKATALCPMRQVALQFGEVLL